MPQVISPEIEKSNLLQTIADLERNIAFQELVLTRKKQELAKLKLQLQILGDGELQLPSKS